MMGKFLPLTLSNEGNQAVVGMKKYLNVVFLAFSGKDIMSLN